MKFLTITTSKFLAAATAAVLAQFAWASLPAHAQSHNMPHGGMTKNMEKESIAVEASWARASVGKNGAAYASLVNSGKAADQLVAVKSPIARRVEIHTHIMDGNIMRMRRVEGGIAVPPGDTVMMKPGGYHVMLMGLNRKLVTGEQFPVVFVFKKAGEIKAMVKVGKAGAMGPAGASPMQGGKHDAHKN